MSYEYFDRHFFLIAMYENQEKCMIKCSGRSRRNQTKLGIMRGLTPESMQRSLSLSLSLSGVAAPTLLTRPCCLLLLKTEVVQKISG